MAANTNTLDPVPAGASRRAGTAPAFLTAGVLMRGDVIEWDRRAYTVRDGRTGPKTRRLRLRDVRTGRERTIRPRRELAVRLLRDRRPEGWTA